MRYSRGLTKFAILGLIGASAIAFVLFNQAAVKSCDKLASFIDGDVEVNVSFEGGAGDTAWLVARFTPLRDGYHLYSKDLPPGGLGFPTLLEIVSGQGIEASGELSAAQEEVGLYIETLGEWLNVYPNGPISLRMPIKTASSPALITAELSVTYDACSAANCLRPVIDKRFNIGCMVSSRDNQGPRPQSN